jgi:(p)ppGpp synthase/HD superfamily hydrolase
MSLFSKDEILARIEKKKENGEEVRADINLALVILGSALFEQKQKSGEDYGSHPIHVGFKNTRSNTKRIIGILHDVVEDSDWEIADLKRAGFSDRICSAVDAMTHRHGELYFDSIERLSQNKDAIDRKIEDLSHNMDASRNSIFLKEKDLERNNKYMIARAYLVAVKKSKITAGTPIEDFISLSSHFNASAVSQDLLSKYSSRKAITLKR